MVNSIKKGKAFERKIVNILNNFYQIKFQRVPMSGGFSTSQNTNNPVFRGDIFTENNEWNNKFSVVIECKTIKKITLCDWVNYLHNKGIIYDWIEQCKQECKDMDFWLIFTYKNSKNDFIIDGIQIEGNWKIGEIEFLDEYLKRVS